MSTTPTSEHLTPPEEKKEDLIADKANVHATEIGYVGDGRETETISATDAVFDQLVHEEKDREVKHRTMSWQRCSLLLAGDQVCLAILSQSWSYKVLGFAGGLIISAFSGLFFWITSITLHKFVMKHPEVRDICDIGYILFGRSRLAYELTGIMFLLNNIMIVGFHVLTGAKVLNTLSDHSLCTVAFNVITMLMGIVMSLPRTLHHVSSMGIFSAICMGISILLFMIFAGVESNPASGYQGDYPIAGPVRTYAWPQEGTTWIDCTVAALNITFLWIPQILFPSFIGSMKRPQDFTKSLALLTAISFVLFLVPASVGFAFLGQYAEAPAHGSLQTVYKKASFAFVIVPTLVIGVIYSNTTGQWIFRRVMRNSAHQHRNTFTAWAVWVLITVGIWVVGWIFAETIPSMGDFLSLLGAAFDSWFGYLFWSMAWFSLYRGRLFDFKNHPIRTLNTLLHILFVAIGLFLLGPGLYASVEAVIADYNAGTTPAFACANLSL